MSATSEGASAISERVRSRIGITTDDLYAIIERMGMPKHAFSPAELTAIIAAERENDPFLAYRDGHGDLRFAPLAGRELINVGRDPKNELLIDWDSEVSRLHTQLQAAGGQWTLIDDGLSRNGTFVNEQRVVGRVRLRDDDTIRIGSTVLYFRSAGERLESTAAATAADVAELSPAERRVLIELCRPYLDDGETDSPATNREIAEALAISVPAVKTQIRSLFVQLEVEDLPQNKKRAELARRGLASGLVTRRDLDVVPGSGETG